MLKLSVVDIVAEIVISPLGPAMVLFVGAIIELIVGRWLRRPGWLTGLALFFVLIASAMLLGLRMQPVVPTYSRLWQPIFQNGADLLWIGDGWNWYISGLLLLVGGLGILLELNSDRAEGAQFPRWRMHDNLAVNLGILGASLLFVGSGNLLTTIFTWVVIDVLVLFRSTSTSSADEPERSRMSLHENRTRGLSLIGAMLLLIGLLLAGPTGPGQLLDGGTLPPETVALLLMAAVIRAGIYPFHLWFMPGDPDHVNLSERFLNQMVPVLGGLWLLGWATGLSSETLVQQPWVVLLLVLSILGSATVAWMAKQHAYHSTFVLTTSAGLAALVGVLAHQQGPSALIWPTTVFALGGGLWLVGERVWEGWGWQLPVSVGALALAGMPFTPGFLTQPSLSRLWTSGGAYSLIYVLFVLAMGLQIAAMLRSWGRGQRNGDIVRSQSDMIRLLAASLALGLPLAVAGFLPVVVAALANLQNAIPPLLGTPPVVVAELPVWITLILPFMAGVGLLWLRPRLWPYLGDWPDQISRFLRLEWLFDLSWWGINQASNVWGNGLRVFEGAGYFGWALVFALLGYLLIG